MESRDYLSELLGTLQGWQTRALCAQTDPEAFFPEKGGSTRDAKRICARCEVRTDCLQYALEHDERFGIWGGLSERERRKIKRQAREVARMRGDRFRPLVISGSTPMINPEIGSQSINANRIVPQPHYESVITEFDNHVSRQDGVGEPTVPVEDQRIPVGV